MGSSRSEQRRDAVFACYQHDVTGRPLAVLIEGSPDFTRELAEGVEGHRTEIDAVISERSHGWDLERIAPLERNLLRVALFEMLHREDVPDEVAIDEAVNLARKYCGTDAPGFVNGILGSVARAGEGAA
jgi:N utilization substance protein B